MEFYLKISFLNDFIFCPRSIYFHNLYGQRSRATYHSKAQINGLHAHKSIDHKHYSTAKTVLQSLEVYSQKYNICGKIDIFDTKTQTLTERKKKIKVLYDGYIFQVYAQYFCLTEMGFEIKKLKLYSMDDNKSYNIKLPSENQEKLANFDKLIQDMQNFDLNDDFDPNPNKCRFCIYRHLCDYSAIED